MLFMVLGVCNLTQIQELKVSVLRETSDQKMYVFALHFIN